MGYLKGFQEKVQIINLTKLYKTKNLFLIQSPKNPDDFVFVQIDMFISSSDETVKKGLNWAQDDTHTNIRPSLLGNELDVLSLAVQIFLLDYGYWLAKISREIKPVSIFT